MELTWNGQLERLEREAKVRAGIIKAIRNGIGVVELTKKLRQEYGLSLTHGVNMARLLLAFHSN